MVDSAPASPILTLVKVQLRVSRFFFLLQQNGPIYYSHRQKVGCPARSTPMQRTGKLLEAAARLHLPVSAKESHHRSSDTSARARRCALAVSAGCRLWQVQRRSSRSATAPGTLIRRRFWPGPSPPRAWALKSLSPKPGKRWDRVSLSFPMRRDNGPFLGSGGRK